MTTAEKNRQILERVQQAIHRPMTQEERREQRISYIMSAVGRDDEKTRREVEKCVDRDTVVVNE